MLPAGFRLVRGTTIDNPFRISDDVFRQLTTWRIGLLEFWCFSKTYSKTEEPRIQDE